MSTTQATKPTAFKDDLHRLGKDVETIKSDIGSLGHDAADAARSGAAELRDGAHHAVDAARGSLSDASHAATDGVASFRSFIARNPLASLGVAAGTGLALAMLIRRSRR